MIFRSSIFLVFALLLSWAAAAQHESVLKRFTVDKKQGCQPLTVVVNAPYCTSSPCTINFKEGTGSEPFTTTKTYSNPGLYWMRILFGATGADSILIEVLPDTPPVFDLYTCGGGTVVTKITDTNTQYDEYMIEYSDGAVAGPLDKGEDDPHTFATAGIKTVSVRGRKTGYEDNCTPMVKTVDAAAPLVPGAFTQLAVTEPTQLQLDVTGSPVTLYKLEIATNNGTVFQTFRDVYNVPSVTVNNLLPDNSYYCFRLGMFNPCTNAMVGYSAVICSADFDAAAQSDVNALTWKTAATGVAGYSIAKADPATTHTPLAASPPALLYNDTDIVCKTEYTYQLTTNYSNGSRSISLPKTVTAFSTLAPTPPQNISAVVEGDNSVTLTWSQDADFAPDAYTINTLRNGAPAGTAQTTAPTYTDAGYDTTVPTCYTISYKDLCDNTSPTSQPACPIQLSGQLNDDNTIDLTWSPYTGWANGVSLYQIIKADADGNLLETVTTGSTSYTDDAEDPENQIYSYTIRAVPADAAVTIQSVSNTITKIKDPNLHYPTAFTPNGDGLNDRFIVFGEYVTGFEMNIFNRWGELLFSTRDLADGWDGTYHGNPMPEGTYAFRAKITDRTGRTFDKSGSVLLLRRRE